MSYIVIMGVKGARRTTEHTFTTLEEAEERAERWRNSNNQGSYWATVKPRGESEPFFYSDEEIERLYELESE